MPDTYGGLDMVSFVTLWGSCGNLPGGNGMREHRKGTRGGVGGAGWRD